MASAIMSLVEETSARPGGAQSSETGAGAAGGRGEDGRRGLVVIGLGANLGPAREELARAVAALRERFDETARVASLYRTAPIGPAQPDFLNSAVALRFPSPLEELLDELQELERRAGRVRAERWGPRTLDLDILWAAERLVVSSRLTVPHPELERRAFALEPLLELVPHASDPRTGRPYAELLASFRSQRIERFEAIGWHLEANSKQSESEL